MWWGQVEGQGQEHGLTIPYNVTMLSEIPPSNQHLPTKLADALPTTPQEQAVVQEPNTTKAIFKDGVPLPWAVVGSVALVVLGAWLKYLFDRRNAKANLPRKSLVCRATFCPDILSPTVAQWHDELELRVRGEALKSPVVVHYRLEYTGNVTAKGVAMRVRSSKADRILRWNFYVDEELKCSRLRTTNETSSELSFEWSYLNPNDSIDLVLLVSPCTDARCVTLEVDGEGLEVTHRSMSQDCSSCGLGGTGY
jgi:hypothetical protein